MNAKFSTRIAGTDYATNEAGRGVFVSPASDDRADWRQIIGTSDTPTFGSEESLRSWVIENYDTDSGPTWRTT
jgi:hypothetical protein